MEDQYEIDFKVDLIGIPPGLLQVILAALEEAPMPRKFTTPVINFIQAQVLEQAKEKNGKSKGEADPVCNGTPGAAVGSTVSGVLRDSGGGVAEPRAGGLERATRLGDTALSPSTTPSDRSYPV